MTDDLKIGSPRPDAPPAAWQPITNPPQIEGTHSRRYLGITKDGTYVFCHYTPAYLGTPDEHYGLWVCEHWGWATKPTHWMEFPDPPAPSSTGARGSRAEKTTEPL